jgi:hypothetical protein
MTTTASEPQSPQRPQNLPGLGVTGNDQMK